MYEKMSRARFVSILLVGPLALLVGCADDDDIEPIGSVQQAGAGVSPFIEFVDIAVDGASIAPCISIPGGIYTAAQQGAAFRVDFDIAFAFEDTIERVQASVAVDSMALVDESGSGVVTLQASFGGAPDGLARMDMSNAVLEAPGGTPGFGDVVDTRQP
jgi:hypothetical protein